MTQFWWLWHDHVSQSWWPCHCDDQHIVMLLNLDYHTFSCYSILMTIALPCWTSLITITFPSYLILMNRTFFLDGQYPCSAWWTREWLTCHSFVALLLLDSKTAYRIPLICYCSYSMHCPAGSFWKAFSLFPCLKLLLQYLNSP